MSQLQRVKKYYYFTFILMAFSFVEFIFVTIVTQVLLDNNLNGFYIKMADINRIITVITHLLFVVLHIFIIKQYSSLELKKITKIFPVISLIVFILAYGLTRIMRLLMSALIVYYEHKLPWPEKELDGGIIIGLFIFSYIFYLMVPISCRISFLKLKCDDSKDSNRVLNDILNQ